MDGSHRPSTHTAHVFVFVAVIGGVVYCSGFYLQTLSDHRLHVLHNALPNNTYRQCKFVHSFIPSFFHIARRRPHPPAETGGPEQHEHSQPQYSIKQA